MDMTKQLNIISKNLKATQIPFILDKFSYLVSTVGFLLKWEAAFSLSFMGLR